MSKFILYLNFHTKQSTSRDKGRFTFVGTINEFGQICCFFLGTGYTLRCDVFVDSIHKIEIATTTRELLLGESPEVFDVYAYDLEGVFSMFCDLFCVLFNIFSKLYK